MSSISADIKSQLVAAMTARATISSFTLDAPVLADRVWTDHDNAPDAEHADFLESARQALSIAYFAHMRRRPNSFEFGMYELVKQNLFTNQIFKILLSRATALDESPTVVSQIFLFHVAALAQCSTTTEFNDWFVELFGPLIEDAEDVVVKAFGLEDDAEDDAEENRVQKKARIGEESRFYRSYTLFRELQMDTQARAKRLDNTGRRASGVRPPVVTAAKRIGASSRESCRSVHLLKRFVSRTSRTVRRAVSSLVQTSQGFPSFPSAPSFAPRLDPKPRAMPGAWPTVSSPARVGAITQLPQLPILREPVKPQAHQALGDSFSRFPRRASSTFAVKHFCPLVASSKSAHS